MGEQIQYQGLFQLLMSANIAYDSEQEMYLFFLRSGSVMTAYAMTPSHTKRVLLLLQKEIGKYEKEHGKIDTMLPADGLKSPFPIKGDDSSGSSSSDKKK